MAPEDLVQGDEWELVNDDGFVYKRKKRPRLESTSAPPPVPHDPAAEERSRRERKKRTLIKLKQVYEKEIDLWEHLSNSLKAMEENTQNSQRHLHAASVVSSPLVPPQSLDPNCRPIIDELLTQTEAQEAIVRDVSNLCDVVEALCGAQEERAKRLFMDLPIWASSPQELLASLCQE